MDLNKFVVAALDFIAEFLSMLASGGFTWRWFKKQVRRRIWKPYLRPAILNQDTAWVPEALALVTLIRVLVGQFWKLPQEEREQTSEALLRRIGNRV